MSSGDHPLAYPWVNYSHCYVGCMVLLDTQFGTDVKAGKRVADYNAILTPHISP